VPADIRAALRATVTIPVRITVDENGRVNDAHVDPQPDALSNRLAAIALEAAQRWQFKPATRGGQSVPSAYILTFRFRR